MIGLLRLALNVFFPPPPEPEPCPRPCEHYWEGLADGMAMRVDHGKDAARQVWKAS